MFYELNTYTYYNVYQYVSMCVLVFSQKYHIFENGSSKEFAHANIVLKTSSSSSLSLDCVCVL